MSFQRVHQSKSQNPQTSWSPSQFAPCPFPVQEPKRPPTQEELENQAFDQHKFEATGLQFKEKYSKITPVEQERLSMLQAKMDSFWAQRMEQASRFDYNFATIPVHHSGTKVPVPIQPKLTIGQPNNQYEQEADRVAEQVMSMVPPVTPNIQRQAEEEQEEIQAKPLVETITPIVQRQEALEAEEPIQAKCESCEGDEQIQQSLNGVPQVQADLENRLNASKGGGSPLSDEVRSFMESRFRTNFKDVRVHTGSDAVQMNRNLSAQAFTYKQDIYFGAGRTPGNNSLTAHELTHVLQQSHGGSQLQRWGMDNAPIGDPDRDPRLAHMRPSRSLTVTAIDDVDTTGWIESFLTIGEVNFTDLPSMVGNILTAIGSTPMGRLNIQVHGSPSAAYIGNTMVTESNFSTHQAQLARLSGHFTSGGFVHLRACDVGQNLPLMRLFAATFGVPVYAGRGKQNNILGVNMGYIVRCQPDGTCTTQFFQP